ncbi:ABC transporter permease [Rhizobium hainanense]|uniref:Capsular polysaccharide transport system permease protein n=1 Tax=Rhizobium hainanense TaxID=52131 RepID=A0A1C3UM83_9HYPH|nr:capsular biosynthesis protein [Rhizobium hainanense]SCB16571.1 capsular polysaccharide transport system permease protein [Rhizobium hainanense]
MFNKTKRNGPGKFGAFQDSIRSNGNAIWAVMLRDMRTRFFNHGLGFIVVPLWPLVHMVVLLLIRMFVVHGAPPYGDSVATFTATGLMPTLTFMYLSRFMAYSAVTNRPMLAFQQVKILDVLWGRAALEIVSAFIMIALLIFILWVTGQDPFPEDLEKAVLCFLATLYLAVGCGTIAGLLSLIQPLFLTVYVLLMILVYIGSGAVFVPSELPFYIGDILAYNPVLVCVEWMRTAYYGNYSDRLVDIPYVLWFGTCALFIGLAIEKLFRRQLMEN